MMFICVRERELLKVASHGLKLQKWLKGKVPPPPQVHDHLSEAGLTSLLYCSFRMVDRALLSAFAERWHRETSSFHLPFGEMTVTLDDVSILLGLKVRGSFYIPPMMDPDIAISYLQALLGCTYEEARKETHDMRGAHMSIEFLMRTYEQRVFDGQWDCAARALIMLLLACTILADKSHIYIDIKYLDLVRDLGAVGSCHGLVLH